MDFKGTLSLNSLRLLYFAVRRSEIYFVLNLFSFLLSPRYSFLFVLPVPGNVSDASEIASIRLTCSKIP